MKLFVGNVSYKASQEDLVRLFSSFASFEKCELVKDKNTGQSRGFAFVLFQNNQDALDAIESLDGKEVCGRPLRISQAREKNA